MKSVTHPLDEYSHWTPHRSSVTVFRDTKGVPIFPDLSLSASC